MIRKEDLWNILKKQEQVILVGVQLDENDNVKESLDELEELAALRSPDSGKNYPEP